MTKEFSEQEREAFAQEWLKGPGGFDHLPTIIDGETTLSASEIADAIRAGTELGQDAIRVLMLTRDPEEKKK